MRSIRREHRNAVFERLEGWWNDEIVKQLTGRREEGLFGYEVSDKLSALSEEYKVDNLPITFRNMEPSGQIDTGERCQAIRSVVTATLSTYSHRACRRLYSVERNLSEVLRGLPDCIINELSFGMGDLMSIVG